MLRWLRALLKSWARSAGAREESRGTDKAQAAARIRFWAEFRAGQREAEAQQAKLRP